MKKGLFLLPILLLAGCAMFSGEEDEYGYEEESGLLVEEGYEDDGYADGQNGSAAAPEVRSQSMQPQQGTPQPVAQAGRATVSADGTVIELPAQQIYIGDAFGGQAPVNPQPGILSYSQPAQAEPRPMPPQPTVITLQNRDYPNTYAQCDATDYACVKAYEQQGYVRVQGLPQFAGYQDILSASDYPGEGRWRNGNNIPRW